MYRDKTIPEKGTVITNSSQHSVDSARKSPEYLLEQIEKERSILVQRKMELQKQLSNYKRDNPTGRTQATVKIARKDIVEEFHEVQVRLVEIKSTREKLMRVLCRPHGEILEDILSALKIVISKLSRMESN